MESNRRKIIQLEIMNGTIDADAELKINNEIGVWLIGMVDLIKCI